MLNLFNTQIESISIHTVGNKSRKEETFLSEAPYHLTDEITPLLKEYFLKPFRDAEESYFSFYHDVHLDYHDMHTMASELFRNPDDAHHISRKITKHLFNQSNHPHIKSGEVYVLYLKNVSLDNTPVDAIGIFKSEVKSDFIQFEKKGNQLDMHLEQGISLAKLDKGCLIFNVNKDDGYKIMSVDTNRYDARYWLEHFLQVEMCQDEHYKTKKYLKFASDFAKEVVLPAEDKKEEVMFMNRAINHFAKNEEFNEQAFINEVIDNPDLIPEFKTFKEEKGAKYSITDVSDFAISNTAVTEARSKLKPVIKLDTGIEIKLNFINPESAEKFVEKGWDEERQMYYYLTYFNNELKS